MNPLSVVAIAFAMSTDAFAAAIAKGAALQRPSWREALRTGAIFGVIEAITPAGRLADRLGGGEVRERVGSLDRLHAPRRARRSHDLGRLSLGRRATSTSGRESHSFWILALTGLATSIDALAVGVGLAFVDVHIGWVAAAIGLATFVMVTVGVMLGRVLGAIAGKRAEILGGLLLIGIGTAIVCRAPRRRPRSGRAGAPTARRSRRRGGLQARPRRADIQGSPEPDIAMARAFLLIRLTLVLVGGLAAASAASAGGPAGDSAKKSGNTFNMVTAAAAAGTRVSAPSAGASLAPKAVVSNPYNVPLLQNAGSLRSEPLEAPAAAGRSPARHDDGFLQGSAMATLPGLPQTDEPEPDALPVEPDDGTTVPGELEEPPGHEPVEPPRA